MKKFFKLLFVISCFLMAIPFRVSFVMAEQDADGMVVGKTDNQINQNGLIVETQSNWIPNSDTYFEVQLPETRIEEDDYLALSFEVSQHVYDYFVTRLAVNGKILSMGESSTTVNVYDAISKGNTTNVNQKYDFFFFFNATFSGTIYIPSNMIGYKNVLETTLNSFRVQYDSSDVSRGTTVVYHELFKTKELYSSVTPENLLFDFASLNTNDNKTINDERIKYSNNLNISNDNITKTVTSIDGVTIYAPLNDALVYGVKSGADGGINLLDESFEGRYVNNVLSLVQFDLGNRSFYPTDGFAFSYYAITNSYLKIILEDEYGNYYMPNIASSSALAAMTSMSSLATPNTIYGQYESFKFSARQTGTVYISYDSLADCKYFLGKAVKNNGLLGKITSIYIGTNFNLSPGGRIVFGSFADVDVTNERVVTIFDTAKLSNEELNYGNMEASTFVKLFGTVDLNKHNTVIEKCRDNYLSSYRMTENMIGLIDQCEKIEKGNYTDESYEALQRAIKNAKDALDNEFISNSDFNSIYQKLSLAKFDLIENETKRSFLASPYAQFGSIGFFFVGLCFLCGAIIKRRKA